MKTEDPINVLSTNGSWARFMLKAALPKVCTFPFRRRCNRRVGIVVSMINSIVAV
jgi:hypothetical protein